MAHAASPPGLRPGPLRCSARAGREELASLKHLRASFRPNLRVSAAPRQIAA